ncbi:uncharacterized protein LOC115629509 [Scaptodrosophila lebanonensis]|uniref:Uncharacterized protein LOC115629509 n=1 Tax=Drosophila lebanonensis TaxID=7225 RepID=A0A6J2U1T6_DROLE|nr:uncharacterized protein LOC115629509 [Scaptodrosophila lebanonensis]
MDELTEPEIVEIDDVDPFERIELPGNENGNEKRKSLKTNAILQPESIVIDLDDEEPDILPSMGAAVAATPTASVATSSRKMPNPHEFEKYQMQQKLIAMVRRQPALYNKRHKRFHDDTFNDRIWQRIAKTLSMDVTTCLSTWAELRFKYQRHVRQLWQLQLLGPRTQHAQRARRPRPTMLLEEDLMFLYPHVSRFKPRSDPKRDGIEITDTAPKVPPTEAAVDVIDLDTLDADEQYYKLSDDLIRLVECVRYYPQLYDPLHINYKNYRHQGLIWGSISNEMKDKATKLMKSWLQLQTRYEWELMQKPGNTPLQKHLEFLAPHINGTAGTVYKMSAYLRANWHDPIEHFRTVMNLINGLKTQSDVCQLTDELANVKDKSRRYHDIWWRMGILVNCSAARCEVTWLVMRQFYFQLAEMRKAGYQLQDKWFFENIIGSLYKTVAPTSANKRSNKIHQPDPEISQTVPVSKPASPPRLPLAIVYPPAVKPTIEPTPMPISAPLPAPTVIAAPTIPTSSPTSSTIQPAPSTSNSPAGGFTIPRITAAISMVPPPLTGKSGKSNMAPTSTTLPKPLTVQLSPKPLPVNQSLPPIPATIQLASTVPPALQVRPQRPMVQLTLMPKPRLLNSVPSISPSATSGAIIRAVNPGSLTPLGVTKLGTPLGANTLPAYSSPPVPKLVPLSSRLEPKTGINSTATVLSSPPPLLVPPANPMLSIPSFGLNVPPPTTCSPSITTKATSSTSSKPQTGLPASRPTPNIITIPKTSITSSSSNYAMPANRNTSKTPHESSKSITSSTTNSSTSATPIIEPSEVTVELLTNGLPASVISISGPTLTNSFSLTMSRTAVFIREIMSIPYVHCKDPDMEGKSVEYWHMISKKFHMPEFVCRACWNFLANNITYFPKIAPMSDLMRTYKNHVKAWEKSHRLFSKFDEIARKYQWMNYKDQLPQLIEHFGKYEHLYWELRKPRPGEPLKVQRNFDEKERLEVWQLARERFPDMNHRDIWSMFKFAFKTYLEDLERGVENPWPQNWWRALEKLKFLMYVRYHPLEPYYYIVHQKFNEEVTRCQLYETLMSSKSESVTHKGSQITMILPWEADEAKRMLTGKLSVQSYKALRKNAKEQFTAQITHNPELPKKSQGILQPVVPSKPRHEGSFIQLNNVVSNERDSEVESELNEALNPMVVGKSEIPNDSLPSINTFELTRVMRRFPDTYDKASTVEKRQAWLLVSGELQASVTECRLSLQHALREFRILKIRDPANRCRLSQKYYSHMADIYRQVKPRGKLLVRTPQDLNQSLIEPSETVFPERFVPEINTITCKPRLVVKNWAYAVANMTLLAQDELQLTLTKIFDRYAAEASIEPATTTGILLGKRTNGALANLFGEQSPGNENATGGDVNINAENIAKRPKFELEA